jgi:hypothetical protein
MYFAFNFGPNLTFWEKVKELRFIIPNYLRLRKWAKLHPKGPGDSK